VNVSHFPNQPLKHLALFGIAGQHIPVAVIGEQVQGVQAVSLAAAGNPISKADSWNMSVPRNRGAGSTFTRPADFDAQRYARQAFGITSGEKPIKVRLLFEPKLAVYVAERMAPEPEAQAAGRWPGRDAAGDNRAEGNCPMSLEGRAGDATDDRFRDGTHDLRRK
jgi:hypothetical protein